MRVYIRQDREGQFASIECGLAYHAFKLLNWEIIPYQSIESLADREDRSLVVGFIPDIYRILAARDIPRPELLDYPTELQPFLGRKVWLSTIDRLADANEWDIFIKPARECKRFTGRAIRHSHDLIKCGDLSDNSEVWCSELVNFVAEYRCFIRYNRILGLRHYQGDWRYTCNPQVIEAAVAAYDRAAPAGYAIDFGVTDKGETLIIEVNDGFALGAYGLPPIYYAQLLSARWAEMTDTEDDCIFMTEAFN